MSTATERVRVAIAVALTCALGAGSPRPALAQAYDLPQIQTSLTFDAPCRADANAELQRGASLLFFLMHAPAELAFQRAAELDPDCAPGAWGEALALARLPAFDISRAAMQRARSVLGHGRSAAKSTPRDRQLLDVTQRLFDEAVASPSLRLRAFGDGMHGLAHADPANVLALGSAVLSDVAQTTLPDDDPVRSARDRIAHAYPDAAVMPPEIAFLRLLVSDDAAAETTAIALRLATLTTPTPATAHVAARVFHRIGQWEAAARAADTAARLAGGWAEATMLDMPAWLGPAPEWAVVAAGQLGGGERVTAIARACVGPSPAASSVLDSAAIERMTGACLRTRLQAWWTDIDWQSPVLPPAPPAGDTATVDVETQALQLLARGLHAARAAWPRGEATYIASARAAVAGLEALASAYPLQARTIEVARLQVAMALAGAYESRDELLVYELQAGDLERLLDVSRQRVPRLVGVSRLAGELHLRLHDYRDARDHFARALEQQPNDSRALLGLARAASRMGDSSAASDAARRFLALWSGAGARGEIDDATRLVR